MIGPVEPEHEPTLLIEPGHSVAVVNASRLESVVIPLAGALDPDQADVVIGFIARRHGVDRLTSVYEAARADRLTWVGYPKPGQLGTDLDRDWLARAVREHDVEAIQDVSINDTWSALRLVARHQTPTRHRPASALQDRPPSPGINDGSLPAMSALSYAGHTDIGHLRSSNDDRWAVDAAQGLYIVADGVATARHGGLAAQMVTKLLPTYLQRHLGGADLSGPGIAPLLGSAVAQLSDDLHAQSQTDPGSAGAEATVVAAVVNASCASIAHLGDSRAYLYRDHQVHRLTRDHSIVQVLMDVGEITPAEAADHPTRSVVTRHMGMTPPASPDVRAVDLQPGDRVLLCTDGLHCAVDDATLAATLAAHPDPTEACEALIDAANQAKSPNNITALIIDIPAVAGQSGRTRRE